jgi:hypothetical protein
VICCVSSPLISVTGNSALRLFVDSKLPIARFGKKPGSRDTFPWFHFEADKVSASCCMFLCGTGRGALNPCSLSAGVALPIAVCSLCPAYCALVI